MRFEHEFAVAAPAERVWEIFGDVPAIARCLPGATLVGQESDGSYRGTVQVGLGPMTASFEGTATVDADDSEQRGRISGSGFDRSGGSRGRVEMDYAVSPGEGGAVVSIAADIVLSGTAAQFGRPGLIEELARRMIGEFSSCLERLIAAAPEEAGDVQAGDIKGLRLFLASAWSAFRRMIGRLFRRRSDD